MIYFIAIFLCNALLFMVLLDDKYRLLTTSISSFLVFIISILLIFPISSAISDESASKIFCVFTNALLLFLSSLFLYKDRILSKLYLLVLSISNYAYITLFSNYLVRLIPINFSRTAAGVFYITLYLLFTCLIALMLYRFFHFFSERSLSVLMVVLIIIQIFPFIVSMGFVDKVFGPFAYPARLIVSTLCYLLIIFCFRTNYSSARYAQRRGNDTAYNLLMTSERIRTENVMTYVNEINNLYEDNRYTLKKVADLASSGKSDEISELVNKSLKNNAYISQPMGFSSNPKINAVISFYAIMAKHLDIEFEGHVDIRNSILKTEEISAIVDEILQIAISQTAAKSEKKRVSLNVSQTSGAVIFEVIYSAKLKKVEKPSFRNKKLSEIISILFEPQSVNESDFNLSTAEDIIDRYSGKFRVSEAGEDSIIKVTINS